MNVEYRGVRPAMTTGLNPAPILNCFEYVYELIDEPSAEYCKALFLMSIREQRAELYHYGNILVLQTYGANEKLAMTLLKEIQEI